uniref:hypothetical protein n=1 Tax=Helicobacter bizzozeronii TaxID=56877 RepID=UPI0039897DB5
MDNTFKKHHVNGPLFTFYGVKSKNRVIVVISQMIHYSFKITYQILYKSLLQIVKSTNFSADFLCNF